MIIKPMSPLVVPIITIALALVAIVFCIFNKNYRQSKYFIRAGIAIALALALLRPMIVTSEKTKLADSNTVIYFIVDSTGSMAIKDESGMERIEAARNDMNKIIDGFVAPKVGVFVQDIITYQSLPITSDTTAAKQLVNTVLVKDAKSSEGSNLNKLIKTASKHFREYKESNPDVSIIAFIMSDGDSVEDNGEYKLASDDFKHITYGAVIGYGSDDGGAVPNIKRKSGAIDYYQDENEPFIKKDGKKVISKKNGTLLKQVASTYGFKYGETGDIDSIITEAKTNTGKPTLTNEEIDVSSAFELYWIFMLVVGILLLVEFSNDFNSLLAEREVRK